MPYARLALGLVLLGGLGSAWALSDHLSFAQLQAWRADAAALADTFPLLAPFAFAAAYALVVALSLPVATFLSLLAGFLFGLPLGVAVVTAGATLGAVALFGLARSAVGDTLRRRGGPWVERLRAGFARDAASYLLFLRLVPLFPFAVVNLVPALLGVPLRTFVWTTFVGILPGVTVYVNLGRSLGTLDALHGLLSADVLLAFGALGLFALVPVAVKSWRNRHAS
jgi:uncharacterized membrane protein YdjX (TVP38/TMEM64 family)